MQAIVTKYLPATNTKPTRIKAFCERGSITVSYPHELSGDACHRYAVKQLVAKFAKEDAKQYGSHPDENPWMRPFATGQMPSGNYCHTFLPWWPIKKTLQALSEIKQGMRGGATMGLCSIAHDELTEAINQ
jgi:hypothetical protein